MQNIKQNLEHARSHEVLWTVSEFPSLAEEISQTKFSVSWDDDENWACISYNNDLCAYLWKRYPLLICTNKRVNKLKKVLQNYPYIEIITVSDLLVKELELAKDDLKVFFDSEMMPTEFSAEDLWYNTL